MSTIPDFLEADLTNMKRTNTPFQRFHKLIHFNLKVMKYIAIVLYSSIKASGCKRTKIDKYIYEKFSVPTEGTWLSFIELLLSCKDKDINYLIDFFGNNIDGQKAIEFNHLFSIIMNTNIPQKNELNLNDYFQRIVNIKNRLISHTLVAEADADKLTYVIEPILDEVICLSEGIFTVPLVLVEETSYSQQANITMVIKANQAFSDDILIKISDNGLYFYFNDTLIFTEPFLTCKDGSVLIYNRYERKNSKVFYDGTSNRTIYIRTSASDLSDLFGIDKEALFLKSLVVDVQISPTGVIHNLPTRDYKSFIGRAKELSGITDMFLHPRHFINALDGIGGVGKTAIAHRLCENFINSIRFNDNYFEHVIWLSAKDSMLKDGKIHKIDQAFEHLEQLLDTILNVLGFNEYSQLELVKKKIIVLELLSLTSSLLVLDNLETIKKGSLQDIWDFINEVPVPTKILLTSREFHFDVPQSLRIEHLSEADSIEFIEDYSEDLKLDKSKINCFTSEIVQYSSGLPIAIKSILGQIYLGKPFKSIKKDISRGRQPFYRQFAKLLQPTSLFSMI